MRRKHKYLPTLKALVFALLFVCSVTVMPVEMYAAQAHTRKARDKKRDWLAVAALIEKANEVRRREMAGDYSLVLTRMELYRRAAVECRKYVKNHVRVGDTVEYAVEVFRLGVLWEQAGNDYEAKKNYDECDRQESKYSEKASYDGEQLLSPLGRRLASVNNRLSRQRLQEIKTEAGGGSSHDYGN